AASTTSTIEYEEEPFQSIKGRILEITQELAPSISSKKIGIDRMKGGGFNRVVAITIDRKSWYPFSLQSIKHLISFCFGIGRDIKDVEEYILRIPRLNTGTMPHDIVTLEFVRRYFKHPIPRVVLHNATANNPLKKAFMVQERLPGESLDRLWDKLNAAQRKNIVQKIINIHLDLQNITNRHAGIVSIDNSMLDLNTGPVKLETLPVPLPGQRNPRFEKPYTTPATHTTTKDMLSSMCERWREYEQTCWGDFVQNDIWDGFLRIIEVLHKLHLIPDKDSFHLCHMDFQMRNILGLIKSDTSVQITGILDWDSAIFAPKFFSYRAPYFLWDNDDSSEEDETCTLIVPEDAEKKMYKDLYERSVHPGQLRYAYSPEFIIARRMFRVLLQGVSSQWNID
ncbi:hypothetical protein BS50DRAFT_477570, partial [Corynespora cassiicola Philippines]